MSIDQSIVTEVLGAVERRIIQCNRFTLVAKALPDLPVVG